MQPSKHFGEKYHRRKNSGSKNNKNIAATFTSNLTASGLITARYAEKKWRKQTRLSGKFNFPPFIYFIHIPFVDLFLAEYMNELYE